MNKAVEFPSDSADGHFAVFRVVRGVRFVKSTPLLWQFAQVSKLLVLQHDNILVHEKSMGITFFSSPDDPYPFLNHVRLLAHTLNL